MTYQAASPLLELWATAMGWTILKVSSTLLITLQALNAYEEFLPGDREKSFLRTKRTVALAGGTGKRCWAYIENGPLPNAG